MIKTFKCGECGTKYSTPGNIPPPSPNWDDGHVCIMMEVVESLIPAKSLPIQNNSPIINYDEDASEARMNIIAQNGNTGEHYLNVDPDAELTPVKVFGKENNNG